MHKILITGAGKIGSLIACLLAQTQSYEVYLVDIDLSNPTLAALHQQFPQISLVALDVSNVDGLKKFISEHSFQALISALPFFHNQAVIKAARAQHLHYFDLTEDREVTAAVIKIANGASTAFVPQCGLAPGMIGMLANDLMQNFDRLDTVKLRVGALPIYVSNALGYALTWSIDGLINEYINPCQAISEGKTTELAPLEGLEQIEIDGMAYEAFNTSGGLGHLAELYVGKVNTMNYKTLRYPGHCAIMHLLLHELRLNHDRETLKRILLNALPRTYQDVVVMYVAVSGWRKQEFIEEDFMKKIYPQDIGGMHWSAIQVATASAVCAVMEYILQHAEQYHGLVFQEQLDLKSILAGRFGQYYRE